MQAGPRQRDCLPLHLTIKEQLLQKMKTESPDIHRRLEVLRGRNGRVYWSDNGQVRVWIGGSFLDLGFHTREEALRVATSLNFQFKVVER